MTRIVLIGRDSALLEGVAQALAAEGYRTTLAATLEIAGDADQEPPPLVALVDRDLMLDGTAPPIRVAQGGAVVVYHLETASTRALSPALQRTVLADVTLPLERHRLVTLIHRVDARARATGRHRADTPPEHRAR
jgi:DNA-binding NtrC family response regulator